MISQACPCPFCRALILDDRPPAHHLPDDLPIVAELYRAMKTRWDEEPLVNRWSRP
jgi:hypothetical protein